MTKNELIDLIYLNIAGGKPATDMKITRTYIGALLPLFIADAVKIAHQEDRRDQLQEFRVYGASSGSAINPRFLRTFTVTPIEDTDRELYSVTLPKKVAILPFDRGIHALRPKIGQAYIRVRSYSEITGVADFLTAYWFEDIDDVQKLFISNLEPPIGDHLLDLVLDFTEFDGTDEVYIPDGMNRFILNEARMYLLGEKQIPEEYKIDYKEDK
jgi:hypothetical protein